MTTAQAGIFDERSRHHRHLELRCNGVIDALVARLAAIEALRTDEVSVVVGLGLEHAPLFGLEVASPLEHPGLPHTPADAWVWLHGVEADRVFDVERSVLGLLDGVALVERERVCFRRFEERELSGFMDGTANPGPEEAPGVALFSDGRLAGSSVVLLQRWIHDLSELDALSVGEQEALFGRTKANSIELEDAPTSSHLGRVVIEREGVERELYRRSAPYGDHAVCGLLFVAFTNDPSLVDEMLARMMGEVDGVHDGLLRFSQPASSARYVVPSLELLADLASVGDEGS
jgi:putative iron-dependent peroxidase